MLVLGLMSGTSADGIDVALARVEERQSSVISSQFSVSDERNPRAHMRNWHVGHPRGTQEPPPKTEGGAPAHPAQDQANLRTWGAAVLRPYDVKRELVAHCTLRMNAAVRKEVLRIAEGGECTTREISQLNFRVGEEFAAAAIAACKKFRVKMADVSLIGSHGQTIFHQGSAVSFLGSKTASTLQIGEPAVIAARTGVPTVGDFRVADMAVGGQGAPLVPYVDWLLLRDESVGRVALNLGGIGNVTVLPAGQWRVASGEWRVKKERVTAETQRSRRGHREEKTHPEDQMEAAIESLKWIAKKNPRAHTGVSVPQVMAFDTGPGNMVIDALVAHFTNGRARFDRDAGMARQGRCVSSLLEQRLADPYLRKAPPKSTGREYYGRAFVEKLLSRARKYRVRPEDLVRTATVFTALSVVDALNRFVLPRVDIGQLIVSGGGAKNPLIMAQLAAALAPIEVLPLSRLGIPEDAKEAYAFALLAYETWMGRTGNLPSATGAERAVVLGKICF